MENFNALLTLSELKTLYSGKPVGICPLYKGTIGTTKSFETTGNPITIPEYKSLVKLTTQFSPKQAGTGDPSPENVRPISGWDSVKVTLSNESESHDYNIILPETIYGGTVDAVTGEGSEEWELIDFPTMVRINVQDYAGGWVSAYTTNVSLPRPRLNKSQIIANMFVSYEWDGSQHGDIFLWYSTVTFGIGGSLTTFGLTGDEDTNTILSAINSYISSFSSAGTPVQVAYKLATPEPFEVSQVSIPSLRGENTFFTNGENMDIIYKETSFWG